MACIPVILILAAMLSPALSRSREYASRAACLNNLRQIAVGIKTYTPDYDDYYPTSAKPAKEINVETHYKDLASSIRITSPL